eukprot:SAG11_NODE_27846_length_328_cov_0.890830_1_plen_40_part_10
MDSFRQVQCGGIAYAQLRKHPAAATATLSATLPAKTNNVN